MSRFKNGKKDEQDEQVIDQPPVFDGTVSLEDGDEEQPPRVKGLVELIQQYYSESQNSKS